MNIWYINDIHVCSECFSPYIRYTHNIYAAGINLQTKEEYVIETNEDEVYCIYCGYVGLPLTAKLIKVEKKYYLLADNANAFVVCELRNWHIKHNGQGDKILMYNSMHSIRTAAVKKNEITTALYDSITNSNINLTSALESFWALVSFS